MRVLFSTTAGSGHFGPMVPVAMGCAAAGHEVAVAAPASFADKILATGLPHLAFSDVPADRLDSVLRRRRNATRGGNRIVLPEVFGRLSAQAALPALTDIIGGMLPDIVVRDPCEFGSLVAAERAGIPQAQLAISLDQFILATAEWLDEPLRERCCRPGVLRITVGCEIEADPGSAKLRAAWAILWMECQCFGVTDSMYHLWARYSRLSFHLLAGRLRAPAESTVADTDAGQAGCATWP